MLHKSIYHKLFFLFLLPLFSITLVVVRSTTQRQPTSFVLFNDFLSTLSLLTFPNVITKDDDGDILRLSLPLSCLSPNVALLYDYRILKLIIREFWQATSSLWVTKKKKKKEEVEKVY
jgi:hypothetical protein